MLTKLTAREILSQVEFQDWSFHVGQDENRIYLQIQVKGSCNYSGEPLNWFGRKWLLSNHMTKSELVSTAFLAVRVALEHEAREQFKFKGRPVFDAHYNVDALWELRGSKDCLDSRD